MRTCDEIVARVDTLATLPVVYFKVKAVLDDPRSSIEELAAALSCDPAMTARVLRVVNSSFFTTSRRIDTVTRALVLLGMQRVHDIVLAWAIKSAIAGVQPDILSMDDFWRGSVLRAVAARHLSKRSGFLDSERLFVEGLLSDIGHLIMYCYAPDLAAQAAQAHQSSRRPLHLVEREILGCDYAHLGASLVRAWNLPECFVEPIACQLSPSTAKDQPNESAMLHVCGLVALTASGSEPDLLALESVDSFAVETLGLEQTDLDELVAGVAAELDEVLATFSPRSVSSD